MKNKKLVVMADSYLHNQNISNNIILKNPINNFKGKKSFKNKDINESYSSDGEKNETIDINKLNDSSTSLDIEEVPKVEEDLDHLKKFNNEKDINLPEKIPKIANRTRNNIKGNIFSNDLNFLTSEPHLTRAISGKIIPLPRTTNVVLGNENKNIDKFGMRRNNSGQNIFEKKTESRFNSSSENKFHFFQRKTVSNSPIENNFSLNQNTNVPFLTAKVIKINPDEEPKDGKKRNRNNINRYFENKNVGIINNSYTMSNINAKNLSPNNLEKYAKIKKISNNNYNNGENKSLNNINNNSSGENVKNNVKLVNKNLEENNSGSNSSKNNKTMINKNAKVISNFEINEGNKTIGYYTKNKNLSLDKINSQNIIIMKNNNHLNSNFQNNISQNNKNMNGCERLTVPIKFMNDKDKENHNKIMLNNIPIQNRTKKNFNQRINFNPILRNVHMNSKSPRGTIVKKIPPLNNFGNNIIFNQINEQKNNRQSVSPNPNNLASLMDLKNNQNSNDMNIINNNNNLNTSRNLDNTKIMKNSLSMKNINNIHNSNQFNNTYNFNKDYNLNINNNKNNINNLNNINNINPQNIKRNQNVNNISRNPNFKNHIKNSKTEINKISQISNILNQNNLINNNKLNNNLSHQRNTIATNYLPNELSLNKESLISNNIMNEKNNTQFIPQESQIIPMESHRLTQIPTNILQNIIYPPNNRNNQSKSNYLTQNNQNIYNQQENHLVNQIQNNNTNLINKGNLINNENKSTEFINQKKVDITYNQFDANGWLKNYGILTLPGKDVTGSQKINQDSFVFRTNINKIKDFNIFGVLDGHGPEGHFVSKFAAEFIPSLLSNHPEIKNLTEPEQIYKKFKDNNCKLIIQSFREADNQLKRVSFDALESGCTCVLIIHIGSHIICANTGDSRAIVVYDKNIDNEIIYNNVVPLSVDYKPELQEETNRIIMNGGVVRQMQDDFGEWVGPYRVWAKDGNYPGLAMSRSIGDLKAKNIGVIPDPGIFEYDLCDKTKYIVVCSDGVWEFLENEKVRDIGIKYYMDNNPSGYCHELVRQSLNLWEANDIVVDDITAVIAFFNK